MCQFKPLPAFPVDVNSLPMVEVNPIGNEIAFESRPVMMQVVVDIYSSWYAQRLNGLMVAFFVTDEHFGIYLCFCLKCSEGK